MAQSMNDQCIEDGMEFDRPTLFSFDTSKGKRKMAWETFLAHAKKQGIPIDAPQLLQGFKDVPEDSELERYEECLKCVKVAVDARSARAQTVRTDLSRPPWMRRILPMHVSSYGEEDEGGSMQLRG